MIQEYLPYIGYFVFAFIQAILIVRLCKEKNSPVGFFVFLAILAPVVFAIIVISVFLETVRWLATAGVE